MDNTYLLSFPDGYGYLVYHRLPGTLDFKVRLYDDDGDLCLDGKCSFGFLQRLLIQHDMAGLEWDEGTASFVESEGTDFTTQ